MFSEKEFNKYIERVVDARESFKEAMKNQDYVAARSFVDKQFYLIHDMRSIGQSAYRELDIKSFVYAYGYADFYEDGLHLEVIDLIDAISGNVSK